MKDRIWICLLEIDWIVKSGYVQYWSKTQCTFGAMFIWIYLK